MSATSTRPYGGIGGGYGLSRESREVSLASFECAWVSLRRCKRAAWCVSAQIAIDNGKRLLQQLASSLHLSQHVVDSAHRLFVLAVQRNFVQGRKTYIVVAACLYVVCRREKSDYLLIDFSDTLQVCVCVCECVCVCVCVCVEFRVSMQFLNFVPVADGAALARRTCIPWARAF